MKGRMDERVASVAKSVMPDLKAKRKIGATDLEKRRGIVGVGDGVSLVKGRSKRRCKLQVKRGMDEADECFYCIWNLWCLW